MKKYEAYKNSGVEWIEKIPQGWSTNRIKFLFSFGRGLNITKADLTETGVPVISYGQIHSKQNTGTSIDDHLLRYVPKSIANEHEECKVKVGDFIFADTSEDKDGCGNCVYVDCEGVFAGYHSLVLDGKGNDNKYFAYLFKSEDWRAQVRSKASGVKVFSITQSIVSDCSVLLPSKEEQQAIASYLDHKVGQIDASVSAINSQIDDLKAYRQSIISEAVTKGLNPNVPMKDSGVEWIGEVPENWNLTRLKFLCKINTGDKDTINRVDNGLYPFYVRSPKVERINSYSYDGEAILMAGDGVGAGKVFHYVNGKFDFHQRVYNIHEIQEINARLLYYYMQSKFINVLEQLNAKSTVDSVRINMLHDFLVPIPSEAEQERILAFLDTKTSKIDATIASLESQRDDLNALKQSVISEAVTGKIDVREWNKSSEKK